MRNQEDQLFYDDNIQRFDADTIKTRYGNNWKKFATNVREVVQSDGSIFKEYIIEDPDLLEEMKNASSQLGDTLSTAVASDEEQQPSLKEKFAQIKAKFEKNQTSNVMGSPSTSSKSSKNKFDDLYARHRRSSNESIDINSSNKDSYSYMNQGKQNFSRSQSNEDKIENLKPNSLRRLDSADDADEEVRQIHRQGEQIRRFNNQSTSPSSTNDLAQQSRSQYEVIDEDGNPMSIDGVQDLIKMAGVRARDVPQPDGSIIKEYVIDDPKLLSKFRSQKETTKSNNVFYNQQQFVNDEAPPPPPRVPLRSSALLRNGQTSSNHNPLPNIQQIRVIEPQRRYEYVTSNGRCIQFMITNSDSFNGQYMTDSDIRELTSAINSRTISSSNSTSQRQSAFNLPKHWYPSVDLMHRQRLGSDTQPYSSNNSHMNYQQIPVDLTRSTSSGAINQIGYSSQNHSNSKTFQTSAQFLPQQKMMRSVNSSPNNDSYHQSSSYPYQGQNQHGVRILNGYNQQQTTKNTDGHSRISS